MIKKLLSIVAVVLMTGCTVVPLDYAVTVPQPTVTIQGNIGYRPYYPQYQPRYIPGYVSPYQPRYHYGR